MRNQYSNGRPSRQTLRRPKLSTVLLFTLLSIMTLSIVATTDAAPVSLAPRRSPLVSAILGSRGRNNGGVGIGIGSGGSGSLIKIRRPFYPRQDTEEAQMEIQREVQGLDIINSNLMFDKRETSSSSIPDSNDEGSVEQPSREYRTLPIAPSMEHPEMEKRGHGLETRGYTPVGTGAGSYFDKNDPYGR